MGAVLIKSHQNSTVERAWLVSQCVPGIRVYGGLVLNETVGGLNPAAVRLALDLGARQIWMPTRSARNHRLQEIVQAVAQNDCILENPVRGGGSCQQRQVINSGLAGI